MAAITYWIDPVSGDDGNDGLSFANAFATPAPMHVAAVAAGNGNDYTVNVCNTGDHSWTPALRTQIDNQTTSTMTIQGVDSSGNPALATINALGASASTNAWIVMRENNGMTIRDICLDCSAATGDNTLVWSRDNATAVTTIKYCMVLGTALGSATQMREGWLFERGSASTYVGTDVSYCYFRNIVNSGVGDYGKAHSFDHCVWVWDVNESVGVGALYNALSASTAVMTYTNCTVYKRERKTDGVGDCSTGVLNITSSSGDCGTWTVTDNVFWVEADVGDAIDASTGCIHRGGGGTAAFGSTDIGYNVMYFGPDISTAAADPTYYTDLPWAPDGGGGGDFGDVYSNDTEGTGEDTALFKDPTSTYDWTPTGSTVVMTIDYDLRLVAEQTAGTGGALPGALPLVVPDNGSGDEYNVLNDIESCVDAIYDYSYLADGGTGQVILLCVGNNLYYDQSHRVLVPVYYDFKSPARYTFTQMNEFVFITSSHQAQLPIKFVQTDRRAAKLNNVPNLSFAVEHYSRIVGAGDPSNPSVLYASGTLNPENWTPGPDPDDPVTLGIAIDDGQKITGLSSTFYGDLFVFKEGSISRIFGTWADPADLSRITISKTRGLLSHHTIQPVGNDIFFWSEEGCHSLATTQKYGDVEVADLSAKIKDKFNAVVDPSYVDQAHSVNYHRDDLYVTFFRSKGSARPDIAFVYHYGIQEWTMWELEAHCSAIVENTGKDEEIWIGTCGGFVYSWPSSSPATNARVGTGGLIFKDPVTVKNYEQLLLYVVPSGDYTVEAVIEFNADDLQQLPKQTETVSLAPVYGDVLGDFTLNSSKLVPDDAVKVIEVDFSGGSGRSATVTLKSETASQGLEVLGYLVRATPRGN